MRPVPYETSKLFDNLTAIQNRFCLQKQAQNRIIQPTFVEDQFQQSAFRKPGLPRSRHPPLYETS
jgi:hypothetical protein